MTRNYETTFIINTGAPDQRLTDLKSKNQQIIESFQGKVVHLDDWGKRKLAYPINKEAKGHYICMTYTADTKCVAELERSLRINEDVVRFLTVRLDDHVDPLAAIAAYKTRLEVQAKKDKERERDRDRERSHHHDDERS